LFHMSADLKEKKKKKKINNNLAVLAML